MTIYSRASQTPNTDPRNSGRVAIHRLFVAIVIGLSAFTWTSVCQASDIVFIRSAEAGSAAQEKLQIAAAFYGLELRTALANRSADDSAIRKLVERSATVGVAIEAGALLDLDRKVLGLALHRNATASVPLFIVGVGQDLDRSLIRTWSSGTVAGCKSIPLSSSQRYVFDPVDGLTWQLRNIEVPLGEKGSAYLTLDVNGPVQRIIGLKDGSEVFPLFITRKIGPQRLFVACATTERRSRSDDADIVTDFIEVAPEMLFVRYCAGERGWHILRNYANFTIDDPWLREPYGYLDYKQLLTEMERHRFHTTIAFIPWNYSRSQAEVISLFLSHPDKLSIAIHGNNHDHKEFTDYGNKPLAIQVRALHQALVRMERFHALTGIPYDRVMIFPHSIAPEATLAALKASNYRATVNASNVPQDAVTPANSSFVLRSVTMSFAGFPSISRFSTERQVSEDYIAINQFLGNPLLFYDHPFFFSKGIDAFDYVADRVNHLEPKTRWSSLGEIVRHLYLIRLRHDSNYDLLAFSNDIVVENTTTRDADFVVQKPEPDTDSVDSVTVDGQRVAYRSQNRQIEVVVHVPSGETRIVAIRYSEDPKLQLIDPSHDSATAYFLRMSSDFRDIYLAKSTLGLAFTRFYYQHQQTPAKVFAYLLFMVGSFIFLSVRLFVLVIRKRSALPAAKCRASDWYRPKI
jgi:hypothetical protein